MTFRKPFYVLVGFLTTAVLAQPAVAQYALENPIGETDPNVIVANFIQVFLGVAATLALIFFIYGGYMWLISTGNNERIERGRKTLFWATMGLLIIFGSYAIVQAVFEGISGNSLFG